MLERTEALITIGTPFDFINSYYPNYYLQRSTALENKIKWLNVYSVADALASNFRKDNQIGEAQFGINGTSLKPINVNYEVVRLNEYNFSDFLMLSSLKAHAMYWAEDLNGQSCASHIYLALKKEELL